MTDTTTPDTTTPEAPTITTPSLTWERAHDQVQEQVRAAIRSAFGDVSIEDGELLASTRIDGEDVDFTLRVELI
ncbi:hypothetical protein [Rathayibacter sp. AY1A7]|uniref:hypothetical protein n=1 Tax=Rathayibacter sp. AY1A7 TaxID=2080524 RepID=UPI000CE8355B|nr:hypothetical protein [Rathayibacter sp. AY1A7]PPF21023.1 hypothetical protein C5B95_06330 [Rathayibacter sp. AY1A7]